MSRNGSGVYTPPVTDFPAVASTLIESTKFNNTINDIATAITGSIAADGQTTITANLPMASHKLTGLSAGVVAGDSVRYEQVALLTGNNTFSGTNIHTGAETFKGTIDATKIVSISPDTVCATGETHTADAFKAGTKLVFAQAAAPTGWTQDASNDQVLRVVSSAGGGSGGTLSITSAVTGGHSLTSAENGTHTHTATDSGHTHPINMRAAAIQYGGSGGDTPLQTAGTATATGSGTASITVANSGSGTAHDHPLAIKYQDVIICSKN